MLKKLAVCAVAFAFATVASGDDKIGKSKAPEVFRKVAVELAKKKGYHVAEKVTLPGAPGGGGMPEGGEQSFEGVVKKDFAALKGGAEAYCKGGVTLVRNAAGRYVEPKELDGQAGVTAASIRNPAVACNDVVVRFAAASTFTADEKVGEIECKIADTWADSKSCEDQLKEIVKSIKIPEQFGQVDLMAFIDKKKSGSAYKAWVGKEDLLLHKIEWTITAVVDKSRIPGGFGGGGQIPDKAEAKYVFEIKDYDKDLDVDVPREIRARFGLKDEPKK